MNYRILLPNCLVFACEKQGEFDIVRNGNVNKNNLEKSLVFSHSQSRAWASCKEWGHQSKILGLVPSLLVPLLLITHALDWLWEKWDTAHSLGSWLYFNFLYKLLYSQLKTFEHNHSMSNFGLFFFFVQMSWIFACGLRFNRKSQPCIYFRWFALHFWVKTYAKNLAALFAVCCRTRQAKETYCFPEQWNQRSVL